MPMLFIGHGHPMNALFDNNFTRSLHELGKSIEKPNAIMVVSAHWETRGTFVSVNDRPSTIYDFGGFDPKLYEIKYEPKGAPDLAREVIRSAPDFHIREDHKMGLDHGAWTVLKHIFPDADIPVFQMSIDYTQSPSYHYALAQQLKKMRKKGVMIIGSGNIVHNLRLLDWKDIDAKPHDWVLEFDEIVKNKLDQRDFEALINYNKFGKIAELSVPTNDHYLPMLYTLGLADKDENMKYIYEGYQYGSLSMRCFQIS
ncbi:MAG: 4,5-DOPA dioxygenase extradiol [Chryseobacterium sp.]|nr:MAG: 4,5-DOPA dioxygenase extradiol [Chryseobacterium sp.]